MPMFDSASTIAAISTPPGKGGVALIRVSGEEAVAIAARCFRLRSGKPLASLPARYAAYGDVIYEGNAIDDAMITVFRAPHSYTGEDTVEITCHGGSLLTHTVLCALLEAGAKQAGPGEFTRRALLSGKLTLTEAEAIGNLLDAQSEAQIHLASSAARGRLAATLNALHRDVLTLLSTLYARLDYPEEDLADLSTEEILVREADILARMERLLASYRTGKAINEGIATVLCGAPNVGKSSLYNCLAGDDLAIVTDLAGTTRDILQTTLPLGNVLLRLCDTAGLRETGDPVESIGVSRSRARMEEAELLLAVFDASRPPSEEDHALLADLRRAEGCVVILQNKSDLPTQLSPETFADFPYVLSVSAASGAGLDALRALIERLFTDGETVPARDAVLASARQYAALYEAKEALARSLTAFRAGLPTDLAASDLERSLAALAALDGSSANEEIIADIFSRFCVGK